MEAQGCEFAYSCATERGKRKYLTVVPVTCRNSNLSILLCLGLLLPSRCAHVTRGFLSYVPCLLSLFLVLSCPLSPVPWCPLSPLVPLSPVPSCPLSPVPCCTLSPGVPCPLSLAVLCKLPPVVIPCASVLCSLSLIVCPLIASRLPLSSYSPLLKLLV